MFIKPSPDFFEPHQRLDVLRHFEISDVQRILVIGVDQLGGLMFTSPFFRELRRAFPQAHITNLVGQLTFPLMQHCPYLDEVWHFDKAETFSTIRKIKEAKFDLVFLLSGTFRTAAMVALAGIPNRVGYDVDGTGWLLTVRLHQEFHSRYRPENAFDLLRAIGINPAGVYAREAWYSQTDKEYAQQWLIEKRSQEDCQYIFAFNPFSTDPKRTWTEAGWLDLLSGLSSRNMKAIMLVAPNEIEVGEAYIKKIGFDSVSVESHSLTKTAAILSYVDFVVGPDSGFIHMALASKHPHVIGLFNVVPPKSCFPVHDKHHNAIILDELVCCPCYLYKRKDNCWNDLKCMKELGADRVLKVIDRWLEEDKATQYGV